MFLCMTGLYPRLFPVGNYTEDDWRRLIWGYYRLIERVMMVVALVTVVGLVLAALGILPPVLAAAAQSLPDLGILANSSRLLRQRR